MVRLSGRTQVPRLQATFVPAENAFAWWGPGDLDQAVREHGLPAGRTATCSLAAPEGGAVVAADRNVRLIDLNEAVPALLALDRRAKVGKSVRSWQEAARLLDGDSAARDGEFADL
ncbi:hypothetical protein ACW9HQ_42980, partial [Nocardia gipuzkoensis]